MRCQASTLERRLARKMRLQCLIKPYSPLIASAAISVQNRFQSTISNLNNVAENASAARSRIRDTDYAAETAQLAKNQVLQQAGLAVLAQANASSQSVLSLLQ